MWHRRKGWEAKTATQKPNQLVQPEEHSMEVGSPQLNRCTKGCDSIFLERGARTRGYSGTRTTSAVCPPVALVTLVVLVMQVDVFVVLVILMLVEFVHPLYLL